MTILQAIAQADSLHHNGRPQSEKLGWLSQLDRKIHALVLQKAAPFSGYGETTPLDTRLLASGPFEEMYVHYLEAKLCLTEGEITDYNSAIAQYNRLFTAFEAAFIRENTPAGGGRRFVF